MKPLDEWCHWYDFDEHKRRAAEYRAARRADRDASQALARYRRQRERLFWQEMNRLRKLERKFEPVAA